MTEPEPLRGRLRRLRASALAQLSKRDGLDAGLLALIANTTSALHALDEAEVADPAATLPR